VILLLAVAALVGLVTLRLNLESWVSESLERRVSENAGAELSIGELRIALLRLSLEVRDVTLTIQKESGGSLHLEIPHAEASFVWDGLLNFGARSWHLRKLRVREPRLVTSDRWLARPGARESREPIPFDLRIDSFELRSGSWTHGDTVREMDFDAEDLDVQAAWSGDRRSMVGLLTCGIALLSPSLERPLALDLRSEFRWRGRTVDFFGTEARGAGLQIEMPGSDIDVDRETKFQGAGRVTADLDVLNGYFASSLPEMGGRASGDFSIGAGGPPLKVEGDFEARNAHYLDIQAKRVSAHALYRPGKLKLTGLQAETFGGQAEGRVDVGLRAPADFSLDISSTDLDSLALLHFLDLPLPLSGRVHGGIVLQGVASRRQSWKGSGDFTAEPSSAGPDSIPSAGVGGFTLEGDRLALSVEGVRASEATFDLTLDMDLSTSPASGTLVMEGTTDDAARTQRGVLHILDSLEFEAPYLATKDLTGFGEVESRLDFGGEAYFDLALSLEGGSWDRQPFESGELDLGVRGDEIALRTLEIANGGQNLSASGLWLVDSYLPAELNLQSKRMQVVNLLPVVGLELDVDGRLSGTLNVGQGNGGMRGSGRVSVVDGTAFGESFEEASALVVVEGGVVRLERAEMHGRDAVVRGELTWKMDSSSATVDLQECSLELSSLEIIRSRNLPVEGRLEMTGELELGPEGAAGVMSLSGSDWNLLGQPLLAVAGSLEFSGDELGVSLTGEGEAGWRMAATLGLSEELPFDVTLNLERSIFDPFKERTPALWARVSGELSARGELARLEELAAEGVLTETELFLGAHRLVLDEELPVRLGAGRLQLDPISVTGRGVDFDGSLSCDLDGRGLDLTAGGYVDLALISALSPEFRGAGRAAFELEAEGTLQDPELAGWLEVEEGRMRWLAFPQTVEQIELELSLEGSKGRLERASALFGGGEVRGQGEFTLSGPGIESYELELDASNIRLTWPDEFEGVYEGELVLSGGGEEALLSGRIGMLRGLYTEEFELMGGFGYPAREYSAEETEPLVERLALDVELVADGGLWLRNDVAEVETGFNFHVGGTMQLPEITGRLWMLEGGEFEYLNVTYLITSGSLHLAEVDRFNPYLILVAETTVGSYEVFLRAEGTLDSVEYELTSSPTLSQQDIIALLTTGRTLEDLTARGGTGADFTGDLAANYFAGALTGRFEKQLSRLLGLERFQINPLMVEGSADPTTRVTVGKEVADNLFVIFSSDMGSTDRQLYQLEWKATRKHMVTVQDDSLRGLGGEIRYTDRYWWKKPVAAAEAADPTALKDAGLPVREVRIIGLKDEEAEPLFKRIPLKAGDHYQRSKMFSGVESIRRQFIKRGQIQVDVKGRAVPAMDGSGALDVIYEIEPGPTIEVVLEGIGKKDERRLRSMLVQVWSESLFHENFYADTTRRIREYFQKSGYYAVDVQHEGNGSRIVFRIDRGKQVGVEQVLIMGAEQLPEERVRKQIMTGAPALFSKELLELDVLEADLAAIRNLYYDHGHLLVEIDKPAIRLAAEGGSAEITIEIEEGPRFTVGEIELPDGMPFEAGRLLSWCGLHRGETFSPARLLEAESGLRAGFDREGYPDARVRGRVELGERDVRISFRIEPGSPKTVGDIEITGNQLTKTKAILRELELGEGDRISREKILRSQHRLYKLGVFRNVRISYSPLDGVDSRAQRLHVKVDEARPLGMRIGLGYDTEGGVRASFSSIHGNLGGKVRTMAVQGHFSDILQRAQIVGAEPRLFGVDLPTIANLSWEHREEVDFTAEILSTAIRVEREFGPKWKSFLRYGLQNVDLFDVEDEVALQEEKLEDLRLGDIGLTLVRDTRDDPVQIRHGTIFSVSGQLFSQLLLSEATFLKTAASFTWVYTFGNGSSFATGARLGWAVPYSSTERVPLPERFFAGGDSTLRGFPRDGVSPVGEEDLAGGEVMLLLNQEYRFPLWRTLKGVVFYDAGNLYGKSSDFDPLDLRHVLGAGLRLEMPIGPLRLEYGRKLDREDGESSGELYFAIGAAF
jgi:outer membrane protein assembly complex protein YaeT